MTEATNDAADAFRDMINRLEQLREDKESGFDRELNQVNRAIDRAGVDHKDACKVLRAMRIEWLEVIGCMSLTELNTLMVAGSPNINVTRTVGGVVTPAVSDFYASGLETADDRSQTWRMYEGMFDDFHYDIGHGKATGEGSVDTAPVNTGFRNGNLQASASGDRQVSVGSPVRTTEMPRYRGGSF